MTHAVCKHLLPVSNQKLVQNTSRGQPLMLDELRFHKSVIGVTLSCLLFLGAGSFNPDKLPWDRIGVEPPRNKKMRGYQLSQVLLFCHTRQSADNFDRNIIPLQMKYIAVY